MPAAAGEGGDKTIKPLRVLAQHGGKDFSARATQAPSSLFGALPQHASPNGPCTRQGTHTQAWIRFVLHAHAVRLKMHHETHLTHQPPSYCWPPTFTEIKTPPGPPPARDAQQLLCRRASWKSSARARACTSEAKVSPCWGAMRRLERCSLQEREARSQLVPPAWLPMHMGCVQ